MDPVIGNSLAEVRLPLGVTQSLRTDFEMEALVNRGLAIAHMVDFRTGISVMRKGGVPMHVAMRVLLRPELRRTNDWKH